MVWVGFEWFFVGFEWFGFPGLGFDALGVSCVGCCIWVIVVSGVGKLGFRWVNLSEVGF